MNIWNILGIEATEDKKKIKSAYRARLREVNPESQQEAFMELRDAYEKALKSCDRKEASHDEKEEWKDLSDSKNAIIQWKEKLTRLYQDNRRRFQTEAWEALFREDVCFSLDTRDEAGREFMDFFGDHPYISQEVLKKAEEIFHFTEKREALMEYFSYELLDYFAAYRLQEAEFPQYRYFAQNPLEEADYDEYIEDFLKCCSAYSEDNKKEAMRILKRLDETGIRHPSAEVRRAWLYKEDEQKVQEILKDIEATWGEYDEAVFTRGEHLLEKQPEEAEKCFRRVLEMNPGYERARIQLAFALRAQKKYEEAGNILVDTDDPTLRIAFSDFLDELEEEIIQVYEKQLQAGIITEEDTYTLAFAYYRKRRIEEAQKTIDLLKGKEEWGLKHLRMCVILAEIRHEWEKVLILAKDLIEKLEGLEKAGENLRYLAEAYMVLGEAKLNLKQKKESLEDMDRGIAFLANQADLLLQKALMLMDFQFYELAADVFSQLIEQDLRNIIYRYERGICYFHLGALQDAHDDFEYVCMLNEDYLDAHIYMMRIYLEAEAKEEIQETFQFFKEKGWDTDSVRLMRGIHQEYSGDYKNAGQTFEEIIKNYDAEKSDLDHIGEVYLHLAQIDMELDKRSLTIFKHLNQGLKKDPEYIPLLEKRWEVNEILDIEDDVEKDVKEILRLNPYHEAANAKMADICQESGQMEKAAEYLNIQQQANDSLEVCVNQALNKIICGEYDAAWEKIALAEAREKESLEVYRIKALYYSVAGDNEKAIEFYMLANEEDDEENYYEEIACCYCHLGDFDAARKQYQKILEHGDKELAYQLLFELEVEQGNYKQAEKVLKLWQVSRKKLFKDDVYREKAGRLLIGKREYKKAKAVLDPAEVTESSAKEFLGILNLYEGKAKRALKYFLAGIKEWPDEVEFYYYAVIANLMLGNKERAEKLARAGLSRTKQDRRVGGGLKDNYKNLGAFYTFLGDFEKAGMYFEKALAAPMCIHCKNCQCKEVYTRMAVMYHLIGEKQKCREMLTCAGEIQPDDIDFVGLGKLIKENAF